MELQDAGTPWQSWEQEQSGGSTSRDGWQEMAQSPFVNWVELALLMFARKHAGTVSEQPSVRGTGTVKGGREQ